MNAFFQEFVAAGDEVASLSTEIEEALAHADAMGMSLVAIHLNEALECVRSIVSSGVTFG